ncbi:MULTISPECIES: hypothetical protein [Sinobaca]|uniref:Uncharacterized protein n=1 Tax=Sinobaca qinghaiensis TaxID=342944 RepID=A0A419UZT9_9BACL|nr:MULTISPECIES: hypothetical protein [Sinobaca]RKD71204.1 hypothetical protein ATL39_2600 [Sinobaca qinghaiensis]
MTETLTAATWFWLLVPMPILIILSCITFVTENRKQRRNRS